MSDLRKQLDRAKIDYESIRYPGDLASDLLAHQSRSRMIWRIAIPLAAAASVLIAFGLISHFMAVNDRERLAADIQKISDSVDYYTHISVLQSHRQHDTPTTAPSYDTPAVADRPETESIPDALTFPTDLPTMPTDGVSSFPAQPALPSFDLSTDTSVSEKEPV
ncbi:hypothetical protein BH10PLA1_BH10PLA1_21020 [soil metagenome]